MAKPPKAPPMAADDDEDEGGTADTGADTGADEGSEDQDSGGGDDDEAGDEDVLLTVCKEADGTYSLIKGDEEDADGADAAGSADAGEGASDNKQTFDSKGALLKGILDILNEDEESEGGEGSAGDQFQAGFDGGAAPAKPMAQKYPAAS